MRDKFVFFRNFKTVADSLPDDLKLKFYDAITAYVFDEVEPEEAVIAALVNAIKPSLDKDDKRGGLRVGAGAPKNNHNAKNEDENNQKQSKTIKDNQNNQSFLEIRSKKQEKNISSDKSSDIFQKKNTNEKFKKPTIEEVREYINERNCANVVDAQKFFDYFETGGWHDSEGKPVKNWKQKLITWESTGRKQRTIRAARGLLGVKSGTYAEDVPL
jgi:hypothetical protein